MRGLLAFATLVLTLGIAPLVVRGAVINVPDPGSGIYTIQDGIDAASPGDEVVVASGSYDAITIDKEITVRSDIGAGGTTINGELFVNAVRFESVGNGAVLRGFTLTGTSSASGIYLDGASPIIEENTVEGNSTIGRGAGIYGRQSSPIIRNNRIRGNNCSSFTGTSSVEGAGIYLEGEATAPEIYNNFIQDNDASCGPIGLCFLGFGGGICIRGGSPRIIGNVLSGNILSDGAARGGALYLAGAVDAVVANNTIYDNEARTAEDPILGGLGGAVYLHSSSGDFLFANNIVMASSGIGVRCGDGITSPLHRTNDLYDNPDGHFVDCPIGFGDLFVDPQMADPAGGDYHLAETSPLIDAGIATVPGLPATDVYGGGRLYDGDGDGTAEMDIGADEYSTSTGWIIGATEAQASVTAPGGRQASGPLNYLALLAVPALVVAALRRRRQG